MGVEGGESTEDEDVTICSFVRASQATTAADVCLTCAYWSASSTANESMNGKLPAIASNSA